jgi:16S rRNA (cytosine1402-N4)-methyltransferase
MNLHHTVMLGEAVAALNIKPVGTYIDATVGAGGHTRAIIEKLGAGNTFLGLDADPTALSAVAPTIQKSSAHIHFIHANFREVAVVAAREQVPNVKGILADLGWRMEQFAGSGKGFSFTADEPLLMTYGDPGSYDTTAADIVNEWDEADIANVIFAYGEETRARVIARAIVKARESSPIATAVALADIVASVVPKRGKIHPATKTFQALRIAVNDEFAVLEAFITNAVELLAPRGRLAVITFHSLEDRIVKHRFRSLALDGAAMLLTKKPITASADELRINPRARSAKLRVIEKQ